MSQYRVILFSIIFFGLAEVASSADRWYEIEVLVFAQTKPDLAAEKWSPNDAGPALAGAVTVNTSLPTPAAVLSAAASAADNAINSNDALKVSVLSATQLQLKDALKSFSRSRNYRPLLHTGWRQPIGSGKEAFKVRLAAGKDFSAEFGQNGLLLSSGAEPAIPFGLWELDGTVKFSVKQFLHIESDLIFRSLQAATSTTTLPTAAAPSTSADANTNLTWQSADAPVLQEQLQFFRLTQSRRLKAKELNYFDHPLFGMLVELRPLEGRSEPDSETEE